MDANAIVTGWLVELWAKRPDWLVRLPVKEDVASLIERIHRELPSPPKPLNAQIAEALGWRTWEDLRPGREGTWFQERDGSKPGYVEVRCLVDYISILKIDVKMHQGIEMPFDYSKSVRDGHG